jgi:3'(2'), 5'-bisphosphate nucleotidase
MNFQLDKFMILDLLKTAIQSSLEAGDIIMEIYNSRFIVKMKEDLSPVTEADKLADQHITQRLSKYNIPIVSEEGKIESYQVRKHWKTFWLVDPLDGTKEFVNKNGEFTVNIALIENEIPILGVVYIPVTKMLYFASTETGARKIIIDSEKILVDQIISDAVLLKDQPFEDKIKIGVSRSHIDSYTEQLIEKCKTLFKEVEVFVAGSSSKFCFLADNSIHLYGRGNTTNEWDTAAGDAIIRLAGKSIISSDGKPFLYNKPDLKNSGFIAGNSSLLKIICDGQ